jgi:CBS domain-containing protein
MLEQKISTFENVGSVLQRKGHQVWHVSPSSTVFEAIAEMADRSVGALPVVSEGILVGIISERDYARKVILKGRSSQQTTVREIMTPSPITVTSTHTVDQCMRIMTVNRVRHLPVVDDEILAGIISIGDLVNSIIACQEFTIDQLQTYISASYPV